MQSYCLHSKFFLTFASMSHMSDGDDSPDERDTYGGALTESIVKAERPSLYRVILINDDYTPMDFVILVLEKFFLKNRGEATEIMLNVHHRGSGVCGVYPLEIAEIKVALVLDFAREHEYPLQCTMEKA